MILVDRLLYKIDFKLNKLASNSHQDIPLENKILALNEAQIQLIKQKLSMNNAYGLGLDGFKKRYEDLQTLVIPHTKLPIEKDTQSKYNRYFSKLEDTDPKYMFYIDSYILMDKGVCEGRVGVIRIIKHADLQVMMNNNHYKSSFEYQEVLGTISKNEVDIYTDGTFTPKELYISYLRYPIKIDKEGYEDFDGNQSTTNDCELPDYLEDELVDLAVQELAMSTENVPAAQFTEQRIKNNE